MARWIRISGRGGLEKEKNRAQMNAIILLGSEYLWSLSRFHVG